MSGLNVETFFNNKDIKRFYFPGKMLWGKGCCNQLFNLTDQSSKVMLFVDTFFIEHEFILDIRQRFGERIVSTEEIGRMPQAGNIQRIASGTHMAEVDMIISIGGGSTIDTAKAVIAHLIYGTFDGVGMGERRGMPTLEGIKKPVFISIPTTAGTGADASRYYVAYDSVTRRKVHGKSWKLIADWILLDPQFVQNCPDRLLINSAFDAFVHFFETLLCKYERSWFGEMLSLDGMVRIFGALDKIINNNEREESNFMQLLYASALSGIAISNIRTGNIHEAAGALLEHTRLSHAETLFVFLRDAYEQYHKEIIDRDHMIAASLITEYPEMDSFEKVIAWWEKIYEKSGITASITQALNQSDISGDELKRHIFRRVFDDKVWIEKESPRPIDEQLIGDLIGRSLARFSFCG